MEIELIPETIYTVRANGREIRGMRVTGKMEGLKRLEALENAMHRRKKFLVYPPNYTPGDGFVVRYSKLQAWKVAAKMGVGASVDVDIQIHPARGKHWTSSTHTGLWGPLTLKAHNSAVRGRRFSDGPA